jgi:FdhD protein
VVKAGFGLLFLFWGMESVSEIPEPVAAAAAVGWRLGAAADTARALPEECAVAVTYDRVSFAVMMASPVDLEDFAVGFSLSEGIVGAASEIVELEIVALPAGVECRMSLVAGRREALAARRRKIAGPVGCGLCGIDSLDQAVRPARTVNSPLRMQAGVIADGFKSMAALQVLNQQTRGVHAAALLSPDGNVIVREDVGRHNALDKVIGAVARAGAGGGSGLAGCGAVLLTSRISIELIQKTAMFGAPILAAISVPTARAVREAEAAGMTLIGVARADGFEVFAGAERILF